MPTPRPPIHANKSTKKALLELGTVLAGEVPAASAVIELKAAGLAADEGVWLVVLHKNGAVMRHAPVGKELALDDINLFFETTEAMRGAPPVPALPAAEAALLEAAGFRSDPLTAQLVLERSRKALDDLIGKESMSLAEAAIALGVSTSRLRQRLGTERSLYGIKQGRQWRVPLFQLDHPGRSKKPRLRQQRLVRNIDKVLPEVPIDVHPLAVRSFFLTENPDLVIPSAADPDDEQAVSPLAWLSAGNPPDDVIALAKEL